MDTTLEEKRELLQKIDAHTTPLIKGIRHIALAGPSGAGKSTIIWKDANSILKIKPEVYGFPISGTTRSLRGNEMNGVDYYAFPSREEFEAEKFLETNEFTGNEKLYGTLLSEVYRIAVLGRKRCCFDLDINGAKELKELFKADLLFAFLKVDLDILYNRLKGRQNETKETDEHIRARIRGAEREQLRVEKGEIKPDFVLDYNNISAGEATNILLLKATFAARA